LTPRAIRWLFAALVAVGAHALLGWLLAGADFMGALAGVRHGQLAIAILFALFLLLRLLVTLFVPAACLAWVALVAWDAGRS
jgi:hypothetical protein